MDLFLFTNFFPYKKAEPFLVNEFEFTKQHFQKITVLSFYGEVTDSYFPANKQLKLLQPVLASPQQNKTIFKKGIFNGADFSFHVLDFFKKALIISPKKLYFFFTSLLVTRTILASASYKEMKAEILRSDDPLLYFYWGDNLCWIIPYLKKQLKNKPLKIVVRLHRTDLYENLKAGYAPLRQQIFSLADLVVPISKDGKDYLVNLYPGFNKKFFLSRLGVFDKGLNKPGGGNVKTIISVSAVVSVKRVDLIFKILQKTNSKIVWHHFGDGPLLAELTELIKQKRTGLDIVLHGFVDNKKLMSFYSTQAVDLLINVSASEGLPVSIMEAFSFGVPVLATDVGGTAELVGVTTGCLVSATPDVAETAAKIDKLFTLSLDETTDMRKACRVVFGEKVSAENNYSEFYKKIKTL